MNASAQVVETSVKVTPNSPSQEYSQPDDHNLRTYKNNKRRIRLEQIVVLVESISLDFLFK